MQIEEGKNEKKEMKEESRYKLFHTPLSLFTLYLLALIVLFR